MSSQLDQWLDAVKTPVECIGPDSASSPPVDDLPVPGARVIIAPHAGYSYSGPAAAYAYRSWDVSKAKRVFLLGPSHHFYLTKCALTRCATYATPLGNLKIDKATSDELNKTGLFQYMSQDVDEDEHSLEMHLPYIYKMLSRNFSNETSFPPLVPIMIGNTSPSTENTVGKTLAPYLADPDNAFVISSDFAHWGSRFRYTYYVSGDGNVVSLRPSDRDPKTPYIHESIKKVDFECMGACESGNHQAWLDVLSETGNTVCGRHPIGVIMVGIEEVERQDSRQDKNRRFRFVRYERSSEVKKISDSSVSYASAFAVL